MTSLGSEPTFVSRPDVSLKNLLSLTLLVLAPTLSLLCVPLPSWRVSPFDPCHLAVIAGGAVFGVMIVARFLGERTTPVERLTLALFLAGMPLVYIASWFWSGTADPPWLWVEVGGAAVYAGVASLGYRRFPWALVGGLAAHGLGWDLWHYGRTSFVPSWYAVVCLVADLGIALYAATRVSEWRRAQTKGEGG